MNWQLIGTLLILSVGCAFAQPPERKVNVLPDGNVQFERDGPELNLHQFRQALLEMKKVTPQLVFHLYVRSEEALHHERDVMEQIEAAGFDVHHVKVD